MWIVFMLVGRSVFVRTSRVCEEEFSAVIAKRATLRTVFILVGRLVCGRTSSAGEQDASVERSSHLKLPGDSFPVQESSMHVSMNEL